MYQLSNIDFDDLYFNGRWLSELGGIVAGKSGLSSFSILPSKEIKSERLGEITAIHKVAYNPRILPIPITFTNADKIRDIAEWLDVMEPTDLYFKSDKIKVKAMFDGEVDLEIGYIENNIGGMIEIKFIAHDPYYYLIDDISYSATNTSRFDRGYETINPLQFYNTINITKYDRYTPADFELTNVDVNTFAQSLQDNQDLTLYFDGQISKQNGAINILTNTLSSMKIFNDGNKESYPLIHITTSALCDVNIGINGNVFTVKNVNGYVDIDCYYKTIKKADENKVLDRVGKFPTLAKGSNLISVTGTNATGIEIQCRSRWI